VVSLEKTNVKVYFSLYGDQFPIDHISKELNLRPTHSHTMGELISRKNNFNIAQTIKHIRKETVWELSTEYEESLDVTVQLNKILKQLLGKEEKIVELSNKYKLECKFMIVIRMNDGFTPALIINKEIIEFTNKIDAEIECDLYSNPYQEE
jgi:hypothetical protein